MQIEVVVVGMQWNNAINHWLHPWRMSGWEMKCYIKYRFGYHLASVDLLKANVAFFFVSPSGQHGDRHLSV